MYQFNTIRFAIQPHFFDIFRCGIFPNKYRFDFWCLDFLIGIPDYPPFLLILPYRVFRKEKTGILRFIGGNFPGGYAENKFSKKPEKNGGENICIPFIRIHDRKNIRCVFIFLHIIFNTISGGIICVILPHFSGIGNFTQRTNPHFLAGIVCERQQCFYALSHFRLLHLLRNTTKKVDKRNSIHFRSKFLYRKRNVHEIVFPHVTICGHCPINQTFYFIEIGIRAIWTQIL